MADQAAVSLVKSKFARSRRGVERNRLSERQTKNAV